MVVMMKPVSSQCNMRCDYCFYNDLAEHRHVSSYGTMSLDTLETVVKRTLGASREECTFLFQGGEPTIAGIGFYEALVDLVERHNNRRLAVSYGFQTNGYLIDEIWAQFLSKNQFLVGLSLDGTKDVHDAFRKDAAGKGTFSKVLHSAQLLQQNGVGLNILTTVTAKTAKSIDAIYGFYSRNDFIYQQYMPCFDKMNQKRGCNPYSLTPELFGDFLCNLFRLWYNDFLRGKRVSIRYFDNLILLLLGQPPETCGMSGQCSEQIVVEADGSVYPCDFYVMDGYSLGNLNEVGFEELEKQRDSLGFVEESKRISKQCLECRWYQLCGGGCRRDREPLQGSHTENYLCRSYQQFFEYAYPYLVQCAEEYGSILRRLRSTCI